MSDTERNRAWKGVQWITPRDGFCPRHDQPVQHGAVCVLCHREQLAAAVAGSREWEVGHPTGPAPLVAA